MPMGLEDVCIFILAREGRVVAILALYVDDFLIGTDSDDTEAWLIKEITKLFKIKVLGLSALIIIILGIMINWTKSKQRK